LIALGLDPRTVMGRAGHRSEATTLTIYAKVRPVVDAAAAEVWGRILSDKLDELRAAGTVATAAKEKGPSDPLGGAKE
jgi:hypothetical protein